MHAPLAAHNEWCCSVTAVSWALGSLGIPVTQEEILTKLSPHFPAWSDRPGLAARCDPIRLLELNGITAGKYIQSNDKEELCRFFGDNHTRYLCGFVQTRIPTNHCMALVGLDADFFVMMNGDRTSPEFVRESWDFLQTADADMLLAFAK